METNCQRSMCRVCMLPKSSYHTVTNILLSFSWMDQEIQLWEFTIWKTALAGVSKKEVHNSSRKLKLQEIMKFKIWSGVPLTKLFITPPTRVEWSDTTSKLIRWSYKKTFTEMKFLQLLCPRISACFSPAAEMDLARWSTQKHLRRLDLMTLNFLAEMLPLAPFMKLTRTRNSTCSFVEDKMPRMSLLLSRAKVVLKWNFTT